VLSEDGSEENEKTRENEDNENEEKARKGGKRKRTSDEGEVRHPQRKKNPPISVGQTCGCFTRRNRRTTSCSCPFDKSEEMVS